MEVKADKKERSAVGMYVSNKSAEIDIPADVGNRRKSSGNIRGIVYC